MSQANGHKSDEYASKFERDVIRLLSQLNKMMIENNRILLFIQDYTRKRLKGGNTNGDETPM